VVDNYFVDLDDDIVSTLGAETSEDIVVYAIVVIPEDISKMTANLKAPVIFNMKDKKGKQVILDSSKYSMRHYIMGQ
jgi:flagellar assembly factor FliW